MLQNKEEVITIKCWWGSGGTSSSTGKEVIGNQRETNKWEEEILNDTKNASIKHYMGGN